jgi:NADH-quinone oxidoreductase subunit M
VIATTGVILGAAYMLTMIQRVFYAELGPKPATIAPRDLDAREHLALWPLAILFLIMGVASPYWMRAIDPVGTSMADHTTPLQPATPASPVVKVEAPAAIPAAIGGGAR